MDGATLPGLNVVIDISHHNGKIDFEKVAKAGILGVIQKATEGRDVTDETFVKNRKDALAAGLLFGSFHFGTASDPNRTGRLLSICH